MFFISKLLSALTQPMFWLALWWGLALLILTRWRKTATLMLWSGLLMLGLLGFSALPDALLRPLENRYPIPREGQIRQHIGLIVLGGAFEHPTSFLAHGQVPLNDAAERMTVSANLLREHPAMTLVFSGGEGRLLTTGITEAEMARLFYQQQGLDLRKIRLEDGSRNTHENAQQIASLLGERCKEPWLLVTSAWHMPRSVAEYEAVGCKVTPYPVDFRTGTTSPLTEYSFARSLLRWQVALHEWLGLLAFKLFRH